MKYFNLLCALILLFCACAGEPTNGTTAESTEKVSEKSAAPHPIGPPVSTSFNSGAIIPDTEIQAVKIAALQGSSAAAERLVNHYSFGVEHPDHQATYWTQIAAENGDAVDEYNYGFLLRHDPDSLAQVRARYWFQRAKKSGFADLSAEDEQFMKSK
jgi:hypothetical protein